MQDGIRSFNRKFLKQLYLAFEEAWSDHEPRLNLTYDLFVERLITKLNIREEASLLEMRNGSIVGFILHTTNNYKNKYCAYNGGTGVVPSARGEGITKKLYNHLIPTLQSLDVARVILEVEKKNEKALHIYQDLGFSITTEFRCYAKRSFFYSGRKINYTIKERFDPHYRTFWDTEPSFLDQPQQLIHNLDNEMILEAASDGEVSGYIIFQPQLGRISQIAVNPSHRGSGIGKALIYEAFQYTVTSSMTIMNIPAHNASFNAFLKNVGFMNEIDQYEMQMDIQ